MSAFNELPRGRTIGVVIFMDYSHGLVSSEIGKYTSFKSTHLAQVFSEASLVLPPLQTALTQVTSLAY